MKIGILGGALDPVHNGHITVAQGVMNQLELDGIMLLPSGEPPHKPHVSSGQDRLRMAKLAAKGRRGFFASDEEIRREGPTYTVDTLTRLTMEHPGTEWVYIIGADALNALDSWREFRHVARLCRFAAVGRPGFDTALAGMKVASLRGCYGAQIELMSADGLDVSSTEIRRLVAEDRPIGALVPRAVEKYIRDRGLYLCDYTEPELLQKLQATLTPHRYLHTLGVASTAQRLAPRFNVDPYRARLAGLLHDCAKSLPLDEMRALVIRYIPDSDEEELGTRAVLHAPAGMILAERDYGVRDRSILSAIRKHTLGDGSMSPMDALIYVSDFIEPGRGSFPGMDKARKAAEKDIYRAMCICAELTEAHLRSQGAHAHPRTLALLDEYAYS